MQEPRPGPRRSAAIPSRSKGVNAYTLLADRDHVDVVCNRYNHTGQLIRRNSGEPVERPLQLVAPDRGGVYLDKRLAELERGRVDRFVAASTPGMWSRIASIVRGPATSGSTLWTDRIRAGKGYSGTGNGEIVTTRLNSVAFIVVEASC